MHKKSKTSIIIGTILIVIISLIMLLAVGIIWLQCDLQNDNPKELSKTISESTLYTAIFKDEKISPFGYETYYRTQDAVYFGSYPQTEIKDTQIIEKLNSQFTYNEKKNTPPVYNGTGAWRDYGYCYSNATEKYMWYIDIPYGDYYYRGVYFNSYRPYSTGLNTSESDSNQFANGYKLKTIYWFVYEPIKWNILSENNGSLMLVSDIILDAQAFQNTVDFANGYSYNNNVEQLNSVYASDWGNSSMTKWLNDHFYNSAFSSIQKGYIAETQLDNKTTVFNNVTNNPYTSNNGNTTQNVFLLSYKDVTNIAYNYSAEDNITDANRQKGYSDYAGIQGLNTARNTSEWWLRSASSTQSGYVSSVSDDGTVKPYGTNVQTCSIGIVPAVVINL